MRFRLSGINKKGEYVRQEIESDSREELVARLEGDGFMIEELKEDRQGLFPFKRKSFSNKELMFFCNSMAHMLGAGLDLVASMEIAENQSKGHFKTVVENVHKDIIGGASLSESIEKYKEFPEIFSRIMAVGEKTGNYPECFESLYEYFSKKGQMANKIKAVTAYPAMLFFFGIAITIIITVVSMPKLLPVVQGFGVKLNPLTQALMNFSDFLTKYWIMVIITCTALFIGIKKLASGPLSRYLDELKFKLPLLGNVYKKVTSVDFASTMSILENAGVNLLIEMDLIIDMFHNKYVKENLIMIKNGVIKGEQISVNMSKEIFDELLINIMIIAEKSGQKIDMLKKVSGYLEQEVKESIDSAVRVLNPLLLLVLGGIVSALIYAVMAPLLDIYKSVG